MTKSFVIACVLAASTIAAADAWEMNGIKGNMASAEDRFKTGNLDNARFFVNQVKDAMGKAQADTKADPEFARIAARLKDLDDKLGKAEGAANVTAEGDEKVDDARSDAATTDPDKAIKYGESCVAKLEAAFKIDPSARTRTNRGAGISGDQMMKDCKTAADKAKRFNSGEGKQRAAETDFGKAGVVAFNAAYKASKGKDIDAFALVEGQKGAESCRTSYGQLTSIWLANGSKKYYDEATEPMTTDAGKLTLKQFGEQCQKMETDLRARKASGCGFKNVSVQQELIGKDRWGSVESYATTIFTPGKCGEMPKSSKWAGSSGSFASQFKKNCGGGAIYIITEGSWHTYDSSGKVFRSIDGVCWDKGKLAFGSGGAGVKH
jgi:hypothetical protein